MFYKFTFEQPNENVIKKYDLVKFNNVRFKHAFAIKNLKLLNDTTKSVINCFSRDGVRCKCCGNTNIFYVIRDDGKKLNAVIEKDGKILRITRDHNILKTLGGSNSNSNMNALCEYCNKLRGSDFAEYQEFKEYYDSFGESEYVVPTTANFCHIDYSMNFTNNKVRDNILKIDHLPETLKSDIISKLKVHRKSVVSNIKFNDIIGTTNILEYVPPGELLQFMVDQTLKLKFHIFTDVALPEFKFNPMSLRISSADFIGQYRSLVREHINMDNERKLKLNESDLFIEVAKIILTSAQEVLQCTNTN